jgi:hypothetical protein
VSTGGRRTGARGGRGPGARANPRWHTSLRSDYRNRLDRDTFAQRVVLVAWASPPLSLLWSQRMRTSQSGAATVAAATSAAAAAPPLPPVSPSEHTSNKIHGTCTPPRNTMPHADAHHAHALVPTQAMIHRHRFLRTQPMSAKRVPWAPTHQSESMPKLPAKLVVVRSSSVCACMDMHAACNIRSPT